MCAGEKCLFQLLLLSRYDDIRWDDSTIVVLNDVRISPPYTSENCAGSSSSAVGRIQKLVREKVLPSSDGPFPPFKSQRELGKGNVFVNKNVLMTFERLLVV